MEDSSKISVLLPNFFSIINFDSLIEIDFKLFLKSSICNFNKKLLVYFSKNIAILINLRFKKRLKLLKSDIIYNLIKIGVVVIISN